MNIAPNRFRVGVASGLLLAVTAFGAISVSARAQQLPPAPTAPAQKAADPPLLSEDNEVRVGRENAEENDRHIRIVTDAAMNARVNRIGQALAQVANTVPIQAKYYGSSQLKKFDYTFKIVDDKDVNAYSLPGGFIYVNKGLIDYCHSDDELAGVLAHEITHAAHHHMVKLMKEQQKIQNVLIPLLAGVLVAAKPSGYDVGNAINAAMLYVTAKTNSYGVEAERDADHGAIMLMTHTQYNPVGLYSFMIRLAVDERKQTYGDLGIFRTHPPGDERAESAKDLLTELHIPIDLAAVDPNLKVQVVSAKAANGMPESAELKVRGIVLCRVIAMDGVTAADRAQRLAALLGGMMASHLEPFEIRIDKTQTMVTARGKPILLAADAAAQGKTIPALAKDLSDAITSIEQKAMLELSF